VGRSICFRTLHPRSGAGLFPLRRSRKIDRIDETKRCSRVYSRECYFAEENRDHAGQVVARIGVDEGEVLPLLFCEALVADLFSFQSAALAPASDRARNDGLAAKAHGSALVDYVHQLLTPIASTLHGQHSIGGRAHELAGSVG
jgi:hypothetical protein